MRTKWWNIHEKYFYKIICLLGKWISTSSPNTKKSKYHSQPCLTILFLITFYFLLQKIAETVGFEIDRLYKLFLTRNPAFKGAVSVAGHSLGSLILFDLLSHQGDKFQEEVNGQLDVSNTTLNDSSSRENTPSQDVSIWFTRSPTVPHVCFWKM